MEKQIDIKLENVIVTTGRGWKGADVENPITGNRLDLGEVVEQVIGKGEKFLATITITITPQVSTDVVRVFEDEPTVEIANIDF